MVLNRWFLAGAAIAVAFLVPDLSWQADHDWATIAMTHALNHENGGPLNVVTWIFGQLGIATLATVWVWAAGLRFLWRSGRPLWRTLALAYGLLFVVFALTTGKQTYYLAGVYVCLLAAGAVSLDGWLHQRPARLRRLLVAMAITTAVSVLVVLPVLPPGNVGWTYNISAASGETVGWPELVGTVRTAWLSLPARQGAGAVIFTDGYAEAAAINELGRGAGLPAAVSGHNADWWWGPATQAPPPWSPSPPARRPPPPTRPTSAASSPACARWPPCPTPTASTTSNGTATSTSAPVPASHGARYGTAAPLRVN